MKNLFLFSTAMLFTVIPRAATSLQMALPETTTVLRRGMIWPATCVTHEQYASMPGQEKCPEPSEESTDDGVDLVWDFFNRYHAGSQSPDVTTEN